MKRIPSFRLVGKRFYDPNAPPCKAVFWTTTDFTWRILLHFLWKITGTKGSGKNGPFPVSNSYGVFWCMSPTQKKRFVRIRHYELLCSRSKSKKLTLCRNLLGCRKYISKLHDKGMPEILKHLYGINVCVCKVCGGKLGKPQLRIPQRC